MESKGAPVTRSSYVPPLSPPPSPLAPSANKSLSIFRAYTCTHSPDVYAKILVFEVRAEIWKFQKCSPAFLIAAGIFQTHLEKRNYQFITCRDQKI